MGTYTPDLALAILLVLAGGGGLFIARDGHLQHGARGARAIAAVVVVLILSGLGLVFAPITASTGATCESFPPATLVLGEDSADARVAEADNPTDRESVRSCIDTAKGRSLGAATCIVVGVASYLALRRRFTSRSRA